MSAEGSANRRDDGFQRWVASMKREHEPMATKPASLKPAVQKLELDLDEGATRIQKFPKELIHRLREKESAKSVPPAQAKSAPPTDDRTAVFRAPPELLARARAMRAGHIVEEPTQANDLPTKPPPANADDAIADSGVQYLPESISGISLRPQGLAGFSSVPAPVATLEPVEAAPAPAADDDDGWSSERESAIEDPTTLIRHDSTLPVFDALRVSQAAAPVDDSPAVSLVESDPVTEALLNTDVDALLAPAPPSRGRGFVEEEAAPESDAGDADVEAPLAEVPAFRRPVARQVLFAAVIVVIALAVFVRLGLALN